MKIGTIVHEPNGDAWVYIGYRITTENTRSHQFVRAMKGKRQHAAPI